MTQGRVTCKDCRFFDKFEGAQGKCHRYPPKTCCDADAAIQPLVWEDGWCGEFSVNLVDTGLYDDFMSALFGGKK